MDANGRPPVGPKAPNGMTDDDGVEPANVRTNVGGRTKDRRRWNERERKEGEEERSGIAARQDQTGADNHLPGGPRQAKPLSQREMPFYPVKP